MISVVLLFLGATFTYTGFLASGRDLTIGLAAAFIGLILIVKPALHAARFCMSHFGGDPRTHGRQSGQKGKVRKIHLKVIKSKDDNPTIH
jgi:hypothetical protein